MTKVTNVLEKSKPLGSSTIKREDSIVKGTRGKGIARLGSIRGNVTTLKKQ
jgi:hypothetical protein